MANENETYVRPTIGKWIRPTMFGPWISISTAATLFAAFGPDQKYVGRWGVWALGMVIGALLASVFTLIQVLVDVLLLAVRRRQLPIGRDAWIMSLGAPLVVVASYALLSPVDLYKYGPWAIVAGILAPMIVTARGVRIFVAPRLSGIGVRKTDTKK